MFEDDSDEEGGAFIDQLTKPAEEQKAQSSLAQIGKGGAQAKAKPKSNNPFGSSSDDDDDDYGASRTGT